MAERIRMRSHFQRSAFVGLCAIVDILPNCIHSGGRGPHRSVAPGGFERRRALMRVVSELKWILPNPQHLRS